MKAKSLLIGTVLALCGTGANAQWVVTDPGNLAQSIINMSDNIAHTSKTAVNTADSFAETVKIYEQAKKYYDQLKAVNDLIQDARKVRDIILMVGDVSDIYVTNFGKMMNDGNFSPRELDAIAFGYTRLLEESNGVLQDLRQVINVSTLSMTDKDRMDVVDRCYYEMRRYRNLVSYYTNKNIAVSYLRARKKNDLDRMFRIGNAVFAFCDFLRISVFLRRRKQCLFLFHNLRMVFDSRIRIMFVSCVGVEIILLRLSQFLFRFVFLPDEHKTACRTDIQPIIIGDGF